MVESTTVLIAAAFSIALLHTIVGPDHYLPFIVLGKAEGWSLRKSIFWTLLCGLGHVLSSMLIGGLGIWLGWTVSSMEWFEAGRGNFAAYGLLIFGFAYMAWGIYRGLSGKGHSHFHKHDDGSTHHHEHEHEHAKQKHPSHAHSRSFWALFLIFVLGPCEPLIPLLMVPAAAHSIFSIVLVSAVFAITTLGAMVCCVTVGYLGLKLIDFRLLDRYVHAMSGFAIWVSGLLIVFMGL